MKGAGIILWILGLLIFLGGSFMETSVAGGTFGQDRIVNMGLQQQQLIVVLAGLALFVAGVIVQALGYVVAALGPAAQHSGAANSAASSTLIDSGPSRPITDPTSQEAEHMQDVERYGIQRYPNGHYRYGYMAFETLDEAIKHARQENS